MIFSFLIQVVVLVAVLAVLGPILGWAIARVMDRPLGGDSLVSKMESGLLRLCGVDPTQEMDWKRYSIAVVQLTAVGIVVLALIQMGQHWLPFNPQGLGNVPFHLALNTAISFVTNTNWQSYGGESTLSYFTQSIGLTPQNFISAAAGISVLMAFVRGIRSRSSASLGNFWVDTMRAVVWILLPLSIVLSIFLAGNGVVQTLSRGPHGIAVGPAASQVAIKQLGTNGGGFFNANSAHPFENPNASTGFIELLAILLIPAALCFSYGHWIKRKDHGRGLFIVMTVFLVLGMGICYSSERITPSAPGQRALVVGGNMEGKEMRFGIPQSVIWATATTAASNGAVNAMHDSFRPMGGFVTMAMMALGEVIFGGVGSGLYGMILFAMLTVFVGGLMIGKTPEYLGKKIEANETRWVIIGLIMPSLAVLGGLSIALVIPGISTLLTNPGAHGLSEVLYAVISAANNNGSAFAGLNANTPAINTLLGVLMLIGRLAVMLPVLAIAGGLAVKSPGPDTDSAEITRSLLFYVLLGSIIVIVGALTFFPVFVLGPIADALHH